MRTGLLYLVGAANAIDCSDTLLYLPSTSGGFQAGQKTVFGGELYQAQQWTSTAPGKDSVWTKLGKCDAGSENGKTIDCSDHSDCPQSGSCQGKVKLIDTKGGGAFNCGWSVPYESVVQQCKFEGFCKKGTSKSDGKPDTKPGTEDCVDVAPWQAGAIYTTDALRGAELPPGVSSTEVFVKHNGIKYKLGSYAAGEPGQGQEWTAIGKCKDHADDWNIVDCTKAYPIRVAETLQGDPHRLIRAGNHAYVNHQYQAVVGDESKNPVVNLQQAMPIGQCKEGTETDEAVPKFDCDHIPVHVQGGVYLSEWDAKFKPPAGLEVKPFRVKTKKADVYEVLYYTNKTPGDTESGFKFVGKCRSGTSVDMPTFDCSQAYRLLPDFTSNAEKGPQLVHTNDLLYVITQSGYDIEEDDKGELTLDMSRMIELGKCKEGTAGSGPKPSNVIDCKDYVYFNPKETYAGSPNKKILVQLDGVAYESTMWGSYLDPRLGKSAWKAVGACSETTIKTKKDMIKSSKDYNKDQKVGLALCCPDSKCAYYEGRMLCLKDDDEIKKQLGIKKCPFENIVANKDKYLAHMKDPQSIYARKGLSTCKHVEDYQIMDYFTDEIVPSAGKWRDAQMIPFTDVGMAKQPYLSSFMDMGNGRKITHHYLGFAQAELFGKTIGCEAQLASVIPLEVGPRTWTDGGVRYVYSDLNKIRENGGDWAVTLGGYCGWMPATYPKCLVPGDIDASAKILAKTYSDILETTKSTMLNFDIEAGAIDSHTQRSKSWVVRQKALLILEEERKKAGKPLFIAYTIPILPTGLTDDGFSLVYDIFKSGAKVDQLIAMTMDYGELVCPTNSGDSSKDMSMFECENSAMANFALQVFSIASATKRLGPTMRTPEDIMPLLGTCPMIGQNDVGDEVYTYQDAANSVEMQKQLGIGITSMWSMTRDRACHEKTEEDLDPKNSREDAKKLLDLLASQPKPNKGVRGNADSSCDTYTPPGKSFMFAQYFGEITKPEAKRYKIGSPRPDGFPKNGASASSDVEPLLVDVSAFAASFPADLYSSSSSAASYSASFIPAGNRTADPSVFNPLNVAAVAV